MGARDSLAPIFLHTMFLRYIVTGHRCTEPITAVTCTSALFVVAGRKISTVYPSETVL